MRRVLYLLLMLTLAGCTAYQKPAGALPKTQPKTEAAAQPEAAPLPPPPRAPAAPVALEEYFKIRRVGGASFSRDGKVFAYMSDQGGRLDVWVKPLGGGEAIQVTRVKGFLHSFAFSPREDRLLFESDEGGNELPHIYLTDSAGKHPCDLVADLPAGARTQFVRWADDGKSFLFLSSRRDPRYLDLVDYHLATGKSKILWESSGKIAFGLASRDHRRFILYETISDVDSNLYLLERGKKKPVLLTQHRGEVLYSPVDFSRDGRTIFYTSDQGSEFASLYAMDLRTRKSKPILKTDWDVDAAGFSETFKYFYTVTNVDGTPKVVLTEAASGKEVALPSPGGEGKLVPLGFSRDDRYLAASLVGDSSPVDIQVIDLQQGKIERITNVLPDSLKGRKMVTGEIVRIPSFDGREVPAFLYRPQGRGPFPAVINVHGGPTAQSKRRFAPFDQYLVSKGYLVLVPNVRGSTGYGKTYTKLDNLDLGGGPLQDVVFCKKWLSTQANADAEKVVVLGGSYGGYMALAAAAFTPAEFAAYVDYFGVSDLKSLVESFPPYWAAFATFIYEKFGDPKNPEHAKYQHDRSPLFFADQILKPLLVVQGENDARVKKDQSDRIVEELKKRNVPIHYLVIPGEGHGFSKDENRLAAFQVTDRFLDRYLFGDASVQVLKE